MGTISMGWGVSDTPMEDFLNKDLSAVGELSADCAAAALTVRSKAADNQRLGERIWTAPANQLPLHALTVPLKSESRF